ncbi:MAG: histidine--tRNA ligase, partial [Thermodesulfobacteriota bacterium]
IQHKLYAADPVQKLYTIGPMFRKERPQKGRYRQFCQVNAEVFGIESAYMDAQLIYMLMGFFQKLSISGLRVHLNSLGCPDCRSRYKAALAEMLSLRKEKLCADCVRRLDKNPLRVLDCKVPSCREVVEQAPAMLDFLDDACAAHFDTVQSALGEMNIPYVIDNRLVRGLDYYTRTAFEIQTDELGAQNAVAGGGRYDGLVELLGGPAQPAVGFAIGMDRLVELAMTKQPAGQPAPDVFFVALGDAARHRAFAWASRLSEAGVRTEIDFTARSLKALMRRADRLGARFVLIVGEQEIADGAVTLRDMATRAQTAVAIDGLVETVAEQIKS